MQKRLDPFTRTPGIAGKAFINMHYADTIIDAFEDTESEKYVYKIVGLRGSGKSVEYSKIIKYFMSKKEWLVCTLSAAGNPINTLISTLSEETYIEDQKVTTTVTASSAVEGSIGVISGNANAQISSRKESNDNYYSPEATLRKMINTVNKKGYKILIGIDDISKTQNMIEFLSIIGSMLLENNKIYLVCTGLNKNIEDFSKEDNLTFFKRSDYIEIERLDRFEVAEMYRTLLGVDEQEATRLSKFVKGYAYAYQVLGSLYCNKEDSDELADLLPMFNKILFKDSYDLIWKSLSTAEKDLVRCILKCDTNKVSDVKKLMDKPNNFAALRSRLENKHLINTEERGVISIDLPQFKEFVELWEN